MKKRIKTSKQDNRHTTKPYTNDMWANYAYKYYRFTTDELARQYNVSKRTIYAWNSEMHKRGKEATQAWINSCPTVKEILEDKRYWN